MSQHWLRTSMKGIQVDVLMGWDRPLQGFFLDVFKADAGDEDEIIFSNLDQEEPHPKTLDSFLQVLKDLEIEVPKHMIDDVLFDGKQNAGNKVVRWNPNGTIKSKRDPS